MCLQDNKTFHDTRLFGATIAWGLPPYVSYPGEDFAQPRDLIGQFTCNIETP